MIEDIGIVSIDADGLPNNWGTVSTGTGSTVVSPTGNVPTTNGSPAQSGQITGWGTLTGINSIGSANQSVTTYSSNILNKLLQSNIAKTSVSYIIVKKNGDTLEFKQESPISVNDVISIVKFISLTSLAGNTSKIKWSTLISTLGIERHFIKGKPADQYPNDTSELFVKLFDAE